MRLAFGVFLSRILVKARRHHRFFGVVIAGVSVGVIVPLSVKRPKDADEPELPGLSS